MRNQMLTFQTFVIFPIKIVGSWYAHSKTERLRSLKMLSDLKFDRKNHHYHFEMLLRMNGILILS